MIIRPATGTSSEAIKKADVLIEALPWIRQYAGSTVVIKYGGNAMVNDELKQAFAEDIVFLRRVGVKPVVVHGGGPQINSMLDRVGIESEFRAGLRVTPPEAMYIVRMVLVGQVGRELVNLINRQGPFAVGMSGEDAQLFEARPINVEENGQPVDLGRVGDVINVNVDAITDLIDAGRIPVVASCAPDEHGNVFNVNADTAASALASALGAKRLVMLTDVAGLYADWPHSEEIISHISASELRAMMPKLASGMRPKMQACLDAVEGGVPRATVIDGRVKHSVLLEIFTDHGAGTMVSHGGENDE